MENCRQQYAFQLRKELNGITNIVEESIVDHRVDTLTHSAYNYFNIFIPGQPAVSALTFDNSFEEFMLCGHANGDVSVTDLSKTVKTNTNSCIHITRIEDDKHDAYVTACKWYPNDESVFMTADYQGRLKLWDTQRLIAVEKRKVKNAIIDLDWIALSGTYVATVSGGQYFEVRGALELHLYKRIKADCNLLCVKWQDNGILFLGGEGGRIFVYDLRHSTNDIANKPKPVQTLKAPTDSALIDIKLAERHGKLLALAADRKVHIWDMLDHAYEGCVVTSGIQKHYGGPHWPRFDVFDGGKKLYVAAPAAERISIRGIDYPIEENIAQAKFYNAALHQDVSICAFRKRRQQLFVCGKDKSITMWLPASDEHFPSSDGALPLNTLLGDDYGSDTE